LLAHASARLDAAGLRATVIDLCDLPADDLLGRARSNAVVSALDSVTGASLVIVGTPVYRAAYSGLVKVFFDLFAPDALAGKVGVCIATGGSLAHQLVIDHAMRPLLASVGALVVPTGVYGTDAQFGPEGPAQDLLARVDRAITEALALAPPLAKE
jgi:FMN reductase